MSEKDWKEEYMKLQDTYDYALKKMAKLSEENKNLQEQFDKAIDFLTKLNTK